MAAPRFPPLALCACLLVACRMEQADARRIAVKQGFDSDSSKDSNSAALETHGAYSDRALQHDAAMPTAAVDATVAMPGLLFCSGVVAILCLGALPLLLMWPKAAKPGEAGAASAGQNPESEPPARDAGPAGDDAPQRSNSHWEVSADQGYEALNGIVPANIHNNFVKKVYALLTVELLYTAAISAVISLVPSIRQGVLQFVVQNPRLFQVLLLVGLLASVCWLMCVSQHYPTNMIALFVFLTIMSINVGVICAVYYAIGLGDKIVVAALITAGIFFALSTYAWLSEHDFSYLGGFLFGALCGLTLLGIVQIFVQWKFLHLMYCAIGILVFSGYIIYDTYMIKAKLGPDDAVQASIALYLDLINLFLLILQMMGDRR